MNLITAIVTVLQLAIDAEPGVTAIVKKGKAFIDEMTGAGVVTKEQQAALHRHIDAYQAAVLNGEKPPCFEVEPDPE